MDYLKKYNEYIEILQDYDIDRFSKKLLERGFDKAPASSAYHGSEEGGLLKHSVKVCDIALGIAEAVGYENTAAVIIAALFHDIGKIGYKGKPNYVENILKSGKRSEAKPYEVNKELLGIPHEVISLQEVENNIEIDEEIAHAILFHNGLYSGLGRELKGHETKLQMIIHFADLWESRCNYE